MEIYREFARVGKLLFDQGLVSLTAGNLSIKKDNNIYITASGSILGDLKWNDIVEVPLENKKIYSNFTISKKPSVEIEVHKNIYRNTRHKAIVHAHTPTAIAISFDSDKIVLPDSEGRFYMREVPVVSVNGGIASGEVAKVIPSVLNKSPAVIIKGHGVFAAADTLLAACGIVSTLEFSSNILYKKKKFENS